MPTVIPNIMNGYQSPLGNAFKGLASVLMAQPTQAEQMQQGAQYQLMQAQGQKAAQDAAAAGAKVQGRSHLGALLADPRLADPTFSPVGKAAPQFANTGDGITEGVGVTPIARAFQPDYGKLAQSAVEAEVNPNDLGGYLRFIAANTGGVRDPRTTNAQVGAGQGYNSTAESFDIGEANKVGMNDADNLQSGKNAQLQADTSRANNRDTIAATNARAAQEGTALDPQTISYLAEQVRNGAPLPALGMGKNAATMRQAILQEAARQDAAAGRTGTDAAIARQDYAGNIAGNRVLASRTAAIGTAVHALDNVIPTVKAQLDEIARTGLYPVDVIINAAQKGTNDPALAKLAVGINDAVNLHARATNPQGQVTDAGRAQGYELLNQAHDAKYLGAAMDQMLVSAKRELDAPGQTRADLHDSQRGVLGGRGAPAQPGSVDDLLQKYGH
jgi:hypothetical protein